MAHCAPGETRTPNRLIRSQMLYPLSYGRIRVEPSGPAIAPEKQMTSGPRRKPLVISRARRDSNP